MSVRTMALVWEKSQHSGTNLLMLLAIADFSDDDGRAYPSVLTLAKKCRMSKRNAQDRLRELAESGELTIRKNAGPPPKYPNLFKVNLRALGVQPTAPVKPPAPVQSDVARGEAHCAAGVQPTAPKPSYNHQEPIYVLQDVCDQAKPDRLHECPHAEVLRLFAEKLPALSQPRSWEGQRATNLRARWRWVLTANDIGGARLASNKAEALGYFSRFFEYVGQSDFLMGRTGNWQCDLPWLMKSDNFSKVIEGKYENRVAA